MEKALFVLYGAGNNGKTTFLETIRTVLGDFALRTPVETLMVRQRGAIPNDVARLRGARFVTANESDEGARLAEGMIKDLTGGQDMITARFMRKEWFEFKPECKIWLGTNHKPIIRGTDNAIWNRIRLIPFTVTSPKEEQDKSLPDKLKAESSGILAWGVRGLLLYRQEGLSMPEEVTKATAEYRQEMDDLQSFIDDRSVIDSGTSEKTGELYQAYLKWCDSTKEKPIGQKAFGMRLSERGFEPDRTKSSRLGRAFDCVSSPVTDDAW